MAYLKLFLCLAALLNLGLAGPLYTNGSRQARAKAVYFFDNKDSNSVVALRVNRDGTLADGTITPTGGAGGNIQHVKDPHVRPDALTSAGSACVSKDVLYVVNAGSNSISCFRIDRNDATKLTQIGQPIDSRGDFPVSITVSERLGQACVSNTGLRAGISCYKLSSTEGLVPSVPFFPVAIQQSNPPFEFPVMPLITQLAFNADDTAMVATVTRSPSTNFGGYVAVYPVVKGLVSNTPSLVSPDGKGGIVSAFNLPNGQIFATNPDIGSNIITINNGIAQNVLNISDPGQIASCWAIWSPFTDTVFISDGLKPRIPEVNWHTGQVIGAVNLTIPNRGTLDSAAIGDRVYFLSPGTLPDTTAVVVHDVSGGPGTAKIIQNFAPSNLGLDIVAQGLALY